MNPSGGDYRLLPGSPGIDGITTDIRGFPRFLDDYFQPDTGVGMGPIVDMGAFEMNTVWDWDPTPLPDPVLSTYWAVT